LIETYFDESRTTGPHPVLTISAVSFHPRKAAAIDAKQKELYDIYQVPLFHAAACDCGDPPFDKLERALRENLRNKLIDYIHEFALLALTYSLPVEAYNRIIRPTRPDISDYTFALMMCLSYLALFSQRAKYTGKFTYIFENGNEYQEQADSLMKFVFSMPKLRKMHYYDSHRFADKKQERPLHTADLVAWSQSRTTSRRLAGEPPSPEHDKLENEGWPAQHGFQRQYLGLEHTEESLTGILPTLDGAYPYMASLRRGRRAR
jgi:hypothetical protein